MSSQRLFALYALGFAHGRLARATDQLASQLGARAKDERRDAADAAAQDRLDLELAVLFQGVLVTTLVLCARMRGAELVRLAATAYLPASPGSGGNPAHLRVRAGTLAIRDVSVAPAAATLIESWLALAEIDLTSDTPLLLPLLPRDEQAKRAAWIDKLVVRTVGLPPAVLREAMAITAGAADAGPPAPGRD
jgi:hypothetical protein